VAANAESAGTESVALKAALGLNDAVAPTTTLSAKAADAAVFGEARSPDDAERAEVAAMHSLGVKREVSANASEGVNDGVSPRAIVNRIGDESENRGVPVKESVSAKVAEADACGVRTGEFETVGAGDILRSGLLVAASVDAGSEAVLTAVDSTGEGDWTAVD
jgi:hypothetical protein